VKADAFVEQNYFRKRASAHTILEEGQQHIAMADRKFIASSLSYSGQSRDSILMPIKRNLRWRFSTFASAIL
jgi:hypothetical protein